MKFEIGAFYKHDYRDTAGKHTEYVYCVDIEDENEGTQYAPFWEVRLYNIHGEGMEYKCDEAGNVDITGYNKISGEEFSKILLAAVVEGDEFLSTTISSYRLWKLERRESRIELPDFGFGSDED